MRGSDFFVCGTSRVWYLVKSSVVTVLSCREDGHSSRKKLRNIVQQEKVSDLSNTGAVSVLSLCIRKADNNSASRRKFVLLH